MNSKKKLLMFSYSFPPIKGIGTLRNFNMAVQFQKHFNIKVLSTRNRFVLPLEKIDVSNFDISYLLTLDYKTIKGKSHLNSNNNKDSQIVPSIKNKFLTKLTNSFPFNLFFGEGGLLYILHGLLLARKYNKKGYHTIYSSFRPMSDHYMAYLCKVFNKNLIWIADYRDLPFYDEVNKVFFLPKFQIYLLKKIIKKADHIITVSEGLKSYFETYNPNVLVLRNGISNLIEKKVSAKKLDKFTITYTGTLYGGKRDPSILFSVIEKLVNEGAMTLSDLNLVYAGKEGALWERLAKKNNLSAAVVNLGMLPLQEATGLQHHTHINLLLTWSTPKQKGILTGKLFEYIKAKQTILVFINGVEDKELENIIDDINIGYVVYNDMAKIEKIIASLYQEWKRTNDITVKINETALKKLEWDYQFDEFYKKIKTTIY